MMMNDKGVSNPSYCSFTVGCARSDDGSVPAQGTKAKPDRHIVKFDVPYLFWCRAS